MFAERKAKKEKRHARKEFDKESRKRAREEEDEDELAKDLEDFAADERLARKLKKKKISEAEYQSLAAKDDLL